MSGFDEELYRELITKIQEGIEKTVSAYNKWAPRLESEFGWIPLVGDGIKEGLGELGQLVNEANEKVEWLLAAYGIPIDMWNYRNSWEKMANAASVISAGTGKNKGLVSLQPDQKEWGGIAGGRYQTAVSRQEGAVNLMQSRANSISSACGSVAQSGFLFYTAVAAAIVSLTWACISFDAAAATAAAGAEPVALGAIISFLAGLSAFLVSAGTAIASLELGVNNQAQAFTIAMQVTDAIPDGKWPTSVNS